MPGISCPGEWQVSLERARDLLHARCERWKGFVYSPRVPDPVTSPALLCRYRGVRGS